MLQQTRVDTVCPFYDRFLRKFPSLRALAAANRDQVLKAWEGLGYYARARRMHQTARYLLEEHGGRFPRTYQGLLALPGVGPYTAAAIGSLAFGLDVPVLDGNVLRVLSRWLACRSDVTTPAARKFLEARAKNMLPRGRAAEFNEAMMELGALICTPRAPRCAECPMGAVCRARALGIASELPVKRKRRPIPHKVVGAGVVRRKDGRLLIAQRKSDSMLGGLWEFPGGTLEPGETMPQCIARELLEELGIRVKVGSRIVVVRHAYSHFTIALHAHEARLASGRPRPIHCAAFAWVRIDELDRYAFSRADLRIIEALKHPVAG